MESCARRQERPDERAEYACGAECRERGQHRGESGTQVMRSQIEDRLVPAAAVNLCDEAVRNLLVEERDASKSGAAWTIVLAGGEGVDSIRTSTRGGFGMEISALSQPNTQLGGLVAVSQSATHLRLGGLTFSWIGQTGVEGIARTGLSIEREYDTRPCRGDVASGDRRIRATTVNPAATFARSADRERHLKWINVDYSHVVVTSC